MPATPMPKLSGETQESLMPREEPPLAPNSSSPAPQFSRPLLSPEVLTLAEKPAQTQRGQLPVPSPPEPSPALGLWVSLPVCQSIGKRVGRQEGVVPRDKVQPGRGRRGGQCVGTDL